MNYLLFLIYLPLLCWLLTRIKFIKQANLGNRIIILLFLIRVLAGLINGWLNLYQYAISDSIGFHMQGIEEYHLLFSNPREYLTDLFSSNYKNAYGAVFDTSDSYWNNLKSNIIIKLLSIFDLVSNRNYFINTLLYNFLVFFGSVALYRVYIQIFPEKKITLMITLFLLPSFLYFTSSIHREGLLFVAIAMACYNMFRLVKGDISIKRILYLCLNLALIFSLRNFVFLAIIPASIAWFIAEKMKKFILPCFIVVYIFFGVLFFSMKFVHPKLDLPKYVSARQMAYIALSSGANSAINTNRLFPNFRSFLKNSPQAINHSLLRPYLTEHKTFLYIPGSLEILLYEILLILYLFFPSKKYRFNSFIYWGIFFSLSMFLIIGYTIPIIGALIRYRSIYFPLVITPIACMTSVSKVVFKHYFFK